MNFIEYLLVAAAVCAAIWKLKKNIFAEKSEPVQALETEDINATPQWNDVNESPLEDNDFEIEGALSDSDTNKYKKSSSYMSKLSEDTCNDVILEKGDNVSFNACVSIVTQETTSTHDTSPSSGYNSTEDRHSGDIPDTSSMSENIVSISITSHENTSLNVPGNMVDTLNTSENLTDTSGNIFDIAFTGSSSVESLINVTSWHSMHAESAILDNNPNSFPLENDENLEACNTQPTENEKTTVIGKKTFFTDSKHINASPTTSDSNDSENEQSITKLNDEINIESYDSTSNSSSECTESLPSTVYSNDNSIHDIQCVEDYNDVSFCSSASDNMNDAFIGDNSP